MLSTLCCHAFRRQQQSAIVRQQAIHRTRLPAWLLCAPCLHCQHSARNVLQGEQAAHVVINITLRKRFISMMLSLHAFMLQEQAHNSEVSNARGHIDHVTLNAVAFQARPCSAPPQKPSRPLSCQTQRVRPATASGSGTATRRRLSPSAGPCDLYSSMSFGVLNSDTESEPSATQRVHMRRAVARSQGQTAQRDKLLELAGGSVT